MSWSGGDDIVIPDQIKQWMRDNCDYAYLSLGVGSMSAGWSWSPGQESEFGGTGGLIRNQNGRATGYVECQDGPPMYQFVTPIPDFDATLTFGIDYIQPGTITTMN